MKVKEKKKEHLLWRILDFIFPDFTELHYIVMVSILLTLFVIDPELRYSILHPGDQDAVILLFVPMLLFLFTIAVVFKEKMQHGDKSFLVMVYYAFIAILAGISLNNHAGSSGELTLFKQANFLLIIAFFVLAILRAVLAWFFNGSEWEKFLAKNLKDDQYRYRAFIITAAVTVAMVVGLGQIYESAATVTVLTFGYLGMLFSVLLPLLNPYLLHSNSR